MAAKKPRPNDPKAKAPRGGENADQKLEHEQRMVWVEQGGIDLREAKRSGAKSQQRKKG